MKRSLLFLALFLALSVSAFGQDDGAAENKQTRAGRFDIQKTVQGRFYFILRSSNGQGILTGYFYASEDKVREAIAKVKGLVSDAANFDIRSGGQQWYFFLKSADGRAVAQSEHYTTEASMKKGIESVRRTAPEASVKPPSN